MKNIVSISTLLLLSFFLIVSDSCKKDDPLDHLPGSWILSSVEVDGDTGIGTGTITFDNDLTGSMLINFTGGGITVTRSGAFDYKATNNKIIFNEGENDELTWERNTDESDEQEFEYTEEVSGTNYNVKLIFTR